MPSPFFPFLFMLHLLSLLHSVTIFFPFSCPLSRCPPIHSVPPWQMLSIHAVARETIKGKKKRKEKRHRGEGITERPQSGNDMGDKTADHSTLQRLVFTWCQLSLPALCSPPCSIDLHSPFYSALFASFPKRATDETWEAWVSWK